jgi:hypothetical protein
MNEGEDGCGGVDIREIYYRRSGKWPGKVEWQYSVC